MSSVGTFKQVKDKLIALIKASHSSLNDSGNVSHVFGEWRIRMYRLENMPIVTVRISPYQQWQLLYGKASSGGTAIVSWSAHVFQKKGASPSAQELAQAIVEYLAKKGRDPSTGICYFYEMLMRESEPERGPSNITRIIIEGRMLVKYSY